MSTDPLLLFIRHGHSVANALSLDEIAAGEVPISDLSLTRKGIHQSEITRGYVVKQFNQIDQVISSDFVRAQQTGRIIFPNHELEIDPLLGELNIGVWSTMTQDQIRQQLPDECDRKTRQRPYYYRPTNGESWYDAERRITQVIQRFRHRINGNIALIGHGQWFNLFDRLVEHLAIEEIEQRYQNREYVPNASVTPYQITAGKLIRLSETIVPWDGLL